MCAISISNYRCALHRSLIPTPGANRHMNTMSFLELSSLSPPGVLLSIEGRTSWCLAQHTQLDLDTAPTKMHAPPAWVGNTAGQESWVLGGLDSAWRRECSPIKATQAIGLPRGNTMLLGWPSCAAMSHSKTSTSTRAHMTLDTCSTSAVRIEHLILPFCVLWTVQ
jgi:hypothetical protein